MSRSGETARPISVSDEAVVWSSDRQGVLGTGPSLPLNILQTGLHVITLTATDSRGHASALATSIFIGSRTLRAGDHEIAGNS